MPDRAGGSAAVLGLIKRIITSQTMGLRVGHIWEQQNDY